MNDHSTDLRDAGAPGAMGARFSPGEVVHHRRFNYRGVVVDVDAEFSLTEEWYEQVARSRPPKGEPWYHVLPDGEQHMTYVAQCNLEPDDSGAPIRHPLLAHFFEHFEGGRYRSEQRFN